MKNKLLFVLPLLFLTGCEPANINSTNSSNTTSKNSEKSETSSSTSTDTKKENPTLFLVGDSTVCEFDDSTYYFPRYGYGTQLSTYFTESIKINNLALSGRSSKSFLSEANYQTLKDSIKEGDYLLIGFGHNDEKTEANRYTNPNTDVNTDGSFKKSLFDNYVKLALNKKATPILASPITRYDDSNVYENNNAVHVTTGNTDYPGGDYAKSVRELAKEKNIEFIDLTKLTSEYWKKDNEQAKKFHAFINKEGMDKTHLNKYGAQIVSYLLASNLKETDYSLKGYLKDNFTIPDGKTYYIPNPNYVESDYKAPNNSSTIFTTNGEYWASVFGDVGSTSKINKENFDISENTNSVHLRAGVWDSTTNKAKTSIGKISGSAGDGLAMYFKKISSNQDFSLKGTIKVNTYDKNNQVGFGIMLKDDMYIDEFLSTKITGDYVAAGAVNHLKAPTAAFSKVNGKLSSDKTTSEITFNQEIPVSISRKGNVITTSFDNITNTYTDFNISKIDQENDYVGFFVSRCADIDVTNIEFN